MRFPPFSITNGGVLGRLKHCPAENDTFGFLPLRCFVLSCPPFTATDDSSASEDSGSEISLPHLGYPPLETVEQGVHAGMVERRRNPGNYGRRRYSFTRTWCSKEEMMNRVVSVLRERGWDFGLPDAPKLELDESNVTFILNELFDGSSDAALTFYFFRWSQRHNRSKHGIQTTCMMIHISALGNMNHIAVKFLHDVVRNIRGKECCDTVCNVLKETSKNGKALETVYSMLVGCLIDEGMANLAVDTLNFMKKLSVFPSIGVCITLLRKLLDSKQLELAWSVFGEMLNHGMGSSVLIISIFIRHFCAHGFLADACKLFSELPMHGCKADIVAYTIIVDALCKKGLLKEATSLLYKMVLGGISPDSVLISALVDGYCKAGRLVEAMGLLKVSGCTPNNFVYNSFISKLCDEGNMHEASELFNEMCESGASLDCINYTTIIGGYCKVNQIDQALKFFGGMLKRGFRPVVFTYTVLIERYCNSGDLLEAERLFSTMKREGLKPDAVTYNVLIGGHIKKGHIEKAVMMLDIMNTSSISPDIVTYNIVIHGFIRLSSTKEARGVLDELAKRGFSPDEFTLTSMIHGLSKEGSFQEALRTWFEMSKNVIKPDVITCSALLNGFCKAQWMPEACTLFHKMLEDGLVPDLILYNTLIRGLCRKGDMQEAFHLLNVMAEVGIIPNGVTYWAVIHGLENNGVENAKEIAAVKIHDILLKNGIFVDKSFYVTASAWEG